MGLDFWIFFRKKSLKKILNVAKLNILIINFINYLLLTLLLK